MKKVVIAGSAKLQKEVNKWIDFFESKNYEVLDYPKKIEETRFMELYPNIHIDYLKNIMKADMLFVIDILRN